MSRDERADVLALERALGITDALRLNCGWTARLTPPTLAPYLVEEAAEVSETVAEGRLGAPLASELGDVLFQILLHARLAQDRGDFAFADVADALSEKLLRRNTHVFDADGAVREHPDHDPAAAERAWQAAKDKERAARGDAPVVEDPLRGLPRSLPALVLAQKALGRAAEPGRAEHPGPAATSTTTSSDAPPSGGTATTEPADSAESIGDELLGLVRRARATGVDAEQALRTALVRSLS